MFSRVRSIAAVTFPASTAVRASCRTSEPMIRFMVSGFQPCAFSAAWGMVSTRNAATAWPEAIWRRQMRFGILLLRFCFGAFGA
jgi:hypothetical protein